MSDRWIAMVLRQLPERRSGWIRHLRRWLKSTLRRLRSSRRSFLPIDSIYVGSLDRHGTSPTPGAEIGLDSPFEEMAQEHFETTSKLAPVFSADRFDLCRIAGSPWYFANSRSGDRAGFAI